jgi:hypothetical protein
MSYRFYAMKQILEDDNDGVLVYVAPTKIGYLLGVCHDVHQSAYQGRKLHPPFDRYEIRWR